MLRRMLGEVPDDRPRSRTGMRWAAPQVLLVVPRQNGKTAILEARALAGLFALREQLIVWSAQEVATSMETLRRIDSYIKGTPALASRHARTVVKNGGEMIELTTGQRLLFRARSRTSVRGLSPDLLVGDEAFDYSEDAYAAQQFATSAQLNAQTIMASSPVDQQRDRNGHVLARLRRGAIAGEPGVMLAEWSAGVDSLDEAMTPQVAGDRAQWARANPALGIRIDPATVERELRSTDPRSFAIERLGVGDWPDPEADADLRIDPAAWATLADERSEPVGPVTLAFDCSPTRTHGAIVLAGRRDDGLLHTEPLEHRPRVAWMIDRLVELVERWDVARVVCDGRGPSLSIVAALRERGVDVHEVGMREMAAACGHLEDLVTEADVRHRDADGWLERALRGAATRPMLDNTAWGWKRGPSTADISPLVAATLALHAAEGGLATPGGADRVDIDPSIFRIYAPS